MTHIRPDPTFGNGGFVAPTSTTIQGLSFPNVGLVRTQGGQLVAGATGLTSDEEHFYLTAYQPDGQLDRGFGHNGGMVSTIAARGWALALQPAPQVPHRIGHESLDMVLIGGQSSDPNTGNNIFAVQRYTLTGQLDTHFGTGGTARLDVAPLRGPADADDEMVWALAVQPDTGILGAGYVQKPNGTRGALVRWHFDGQLDTSFGSNQGSTGPGRLIYPALDAPGNLWGDVPDTAFQFIAFQPNGRILVAGTYGAQFLVARLTADGSFDPSFGQNGRVLLTIGFSWAGSPRLLVQADGRIILIATVGSPTGSGLDDDVTAIGLARLLPNGDLDRTFGWLIPGSYGPPANRLGGKVDHRLGWNIQNVPGTGFEGVNDAVLEGGAHEAIIGVGGTQTLSAFRGEFLVARYTANGDIDTQSTGPTGAIETAFPNGAGQISSCVHDVQANTLTVAGGVSAADHTGIGLARYLLSA